MGIVRSLFSGPKAPLQPKGDASFSQPDERDRQALFWWLKRNTSWSAIASNSALWEQFIQSYEAWLRSMDDPYQRYIEAFKYGLDTQSNYEKGLKGLLRGDKGVFNHESSHGWLANLLTSSVSQRLGWYADPDDIARIERCPESMVRLYIKAHNAAIAVGRTTTYRGMGFPRGSARSLLAALPVDTTLPEPRWDVSFSPGKSAPLDGIYEMVNQDGHIVGSLQHFVRSERAAEKDLVEFGADAGNEEASAFLWRLLWQDDRYEDGRIPDEEPLYPMPEQSTEPVHDPADERSLRCEANQPCPRTGFWFTPSRAESRRRFEQGETMPANGSDYGVTIWQWDIDQGA